MLMSPMRDGRTTSKDSATQLLICELLSFAIIMAIILLIILLNRLKVRGLFHAPQSTLNKVKMKILHFTFDKVNIYRAGNTITDSTTGFVHN